LTQENIDAMANGLILPYLGMALFIGVLAAALLISPLPELAKEDDESTSGSRSQILEALSHPRLALGVAAIFFYVAVEVIAGDTIGTFALSLGVKNYAVMTSYTMLCMVVGYLIGILVIPRFITQQTALAASAIFGSLIVLCIVFGDSQSFAIANAILVPFGGTALPDTLLFIAVLGLANAIVWPAVWPLALSGMGKLTSVGSGLLVMGIAGGAFGPLIWGLSSGGSWGMQGGYMVMLPCYLFILFYAIKGHKLTSWK
ncbi:MAG: glucose/galactose MFS transporter, partial [Moraxellaceae bacterium]